jgi:hypothetical protein
MAESVWSLLHPSSAGLVLLDFVADTFLLLGLMGIYLPRSAALGIGGLLAFLLCFAGLQLIHIPDGTADHLGPPTVFIGMALLATMLLLRTRFPRLGLWLWLVSFGFALLRLWHTFIHWAIFVAAVLLSLGFTVAGLSLAIRGADRLGASATDPAR